MGLVLRIVATFARFFSFLILTSSSRTCHRIQKFSRTSVLSLLYCFQLIRRQILHSSYIQCCLALNRRSRFRSVVPKLCHRMSYGKLPWTNTNSPGSLLGWTIGQMFRCFRRETEVKRDTKEKREEGKREERDWRSNGKGLRVGPEQHQHESSNHSRYMKHVTRNHAQDHGMFICAYIIIQKIVCAHTYTCIRSMMCIVRSLLPYTMVSCFLQISSLYSSDRQRRKCQHQDPSDSNACAMWGTWSGRATEGNRTIICYPIQVTFSKKKRLVILIVI